MFGPQETDRLSKLALSVFFAGIFVIALGAGLFAFKNQGDDEIQIIESDISTGAGQIVVHVDGAVKAPGVYSLNTGSRVADAVKSAGGLTEQADQAKINLAAKLTDGQKIHVSQVGELKGFTLGKPYSKTDPVSQGSEGVNINSDSQTELESLPGIGPVTAQKIIASRPYSAVEELLTRKVVSKSVYEKIKEQITVF